jgi:hypothetical protein
MPRFLRFVHVWAAVLATASCAKSGQDQTVLQTQDLTDTGNAGSFDPNEIVDYGSFTDESGLGASDVQGFLQSTPYNRPSFLSTYESGGVRAVDAVVAASQKYSLNPLAFLVRAEMDQGLVGVQYYPIDQPSRVEYVFGCGCDGAGTCDPALAGFDKQVDCYGQAMRSMLDDITANGANNGGWAPGNASETVDGQSVTPADVSTAALYRYTPKVAVGQPGGNWLYWNIWQLYAQALGYAGPIGPGSGGAWVGDACTADALCTFNGGICATNYPGGMCTAACSSSTPCPTEQGQAQTFCANFAQGGYCLVVCNPSVPASCRQGYTCQAVQGAAGNDSANVCVGGQ